MPLLFQVSLGEWEEDRCIKWGDPDAAAPNPGAPSNGLSLPRPRRRTPPPPSTPTSSRSRNNSRGGICAGRAPVSLSFPPSQTRSFRFEKGPPQVLVGAALSVDGGRARCRPVCLPPDSGRRKKRSVFERRGSGYEWACLRGDGPGGPTSHPPSSLERPPLPAQIKALVPHPASDCVRWKGG